VDYIPNQNVRRFTFSFVIEFILRFHVEVKCTQAKNMLTRLKMIQKTQITRTSIVTMIPR
jgi:hypothetical protein